jgi:FkbM family methyltransferase
MPPEAIPVYPVYNGKKTKLLVHKGGRLEQEIEKRGGFYEGDLLDYLFHLELGGTYVNVGAHVGNHSVFFAEHCPCDEVIAIEPDKHNFETLSENAKTRIKIKTVHAAACNANDGCCPVRFGEKPELSKVDFKTRTSPKHHGCDCVTVDMVAAGKPVSILKIDIDGDPSQVLEGSQETIRRCHPVVAVDYGSGDSACNSSKVLGRLMYAEIARYGATPVSICVPATFHVAFPMYNRIGVTMNLLRDLDREVDVARGLGAKVDVCVYDDASTDDVSSVVEFLRERGWGYYRFERNHGKKGFWEVITKIFQDIEFHGQKDLMVLLNNDVRISTRFFERILASWNSISDHKKACLNIQAEERRDKVPQWTDFPPQKHNALTWKTQWNDGMLVCLVECLKIVGFHIEKPPESRWKNPNISSGVWQWFSCELHRRGWGLYRVNESLTVHLMVPSSMHGDLRKKEPLRCSNFADGPGAFVRLMTDEKICASLASIPSREEQLEQVVDSLLPQVDQLCVYLNGYKHVPRFLKQDRIVVGRSQDTGDLGDAGKFFWCERDSGYQFTCDDDLIYSQDYCVTLIEAIERYDRKAVVGLHGISLHDYPRESYYRCRNVTMCLSSFGADRYVHILGTGAMAYHSSALKMTMKNFEHPNMADIWVGLFCQEHKIPMVCVAREKGLLTLLHCHWTIYNEHSKNDRIQTDAVNRVHQWKVSRVVP